MPLVSRDKQRVNRNGINLDLIKSQITEKVNNSFKKERKSVDVSAASSSKKARL